MSVPVQPAARILTVCTGNVCRSPLMERLLQRAVDDAFGAGIVEVRSAGTGALVDHAMDERSAVVLADLGGDDEGFRARRLTEEHVREADLILAATRDHRSTAVQKHPRALKRAFTVREFARLIEGADLSDLPESPKERIDALVETARMRRSALAGVDPSTLDVIDPFRREDAVYDQMRSEIEPAMATIVEALNGRRGQGG